MLTNKVEVRMVVDPSIYELIAETANAVAGAPRSLKDRLELLFERRDLFFKVGSVQGDAGSAGASEVIVALNPTDLFRSLPAAIRTGDIDRLIVEE